MMWSLEQQRDLWGLLPGAAGSRALVARYERDHMRELARRSAASRCQRRDAQPRMVQYVEVSQVVIERIIPWWPHQPRRRQRKTPVLVQIELVCMLPVVQAQSAIGGAR